ncbi:GGDEF domain-containing protein [Mangrovitalea sediminis]|uniref:GGDEF domain-containing protein n=1 Tax=Mangrovitalea sediminis TaxID=1982043 RepID=UPI000BE528B0|nr:GGDEF domain-containing protein [Mangrovitalea sediminis]
MLEISLHTYIYALHLALILLTGGIVLVTFSLQSKTLPVASIRLFKAFFVFSIIGWILFALKDIDGHRHPLIPAGSAYIISGFLLFIAVKQYSKVSNKLILTIGFHCFVFFLNWRATQPLQHLMIVSTYAFIAYSGIFYTSFQRALKLKNVGNGLIAFGALLVVVTAPVQFYLGYEADALLTAYSLAFVTTTSSFVLVSIGFLTAILIHKHRQLLNQALNDPLTGVLNRRGLSNALTTLLPILKARNSALNVIVVDIDHFKRINDTHGHQVGDLVLAEVARQLEHFSRASDLVARIGGEEFVILLPGLSAETTLMIAERIRQKIATTPVVLPERNIKVTASFGIASASGRINFETLLNDADQLMYQAKHQGRNCVCVQEKRSASLAG